MKYTVTFTQYHTYTVDAEDEDSAFDEAHEEFKGDMRSSIAATWYDDVEIECNEEDEDDFDRRCETCYANDMEHDEVDNPCWNCDANYSGWMPKND